MKRETLIGFAIMLMISCEKRIHDANEFNKKPEQKEIEEIKSINIIGSKKLIEINFPKLWDAHGQDSVYSQNIDSVFSDKLKFSGEFDTTYSAVLRGKYSGSNDLFKYDDFITKSMQVETSHMNEYELLYYIQINENILAAFYRMNKLDIGKNNLYDRVDLCTIDIRKNEVVDVLNVLIEREVSGIDCLKYFYANDLGHLYLKQFTSDHGYWASISYDIWQVSNSGRFVRYYENDGQYKDENEAGLVVKSKRHGKWIECKYNSLVRKYTYSEQLYENGLPTGHWSFFKLKFPLDDEGNRLEDQPSKGPLLYTEIYSDYKLEERAFNK